MHGPGGYVFDYDKRFTLELSLGPALFLKPAQCTSDRYYRSLRHTRFFTYEVVHGG